MTAGLGTATMGGTAPFVDQLLVQFTGRPWAPAVYVATVAWRARIRDPQPGPSGR